MRKREIKVQGRRKGGLGGVRLFKIVVKTTLADLSLDSLDMTCQFFFSIY